jgi:hypothetical protein
MTLKTAMEDQRGDKPWYLTDRARWLAYVYLTQDESVRVDDVSDLGIGVDLLVRLGESREEEDWIMGVVAEGVVSLSEQAKQEDSALWIPRTEFDVSSFSDLPDLPILLAYYTMSDEQGYGAAFLNGECNALALPNEILPSCTDINEDMIGPFLPLTERRYYSLIGRGVSISGMRGSESKTLSNKEEGRLTAIRSLFSSGTSPAD